MPRRQRAPSVRHLGQISYLRQTSSDGKMMGYPKILENLVGKMMFFHVFSHEHARTIHKQHQKCGKKRGKSTDFWTTVPNYQLIRWMKWNFFFGLPVFRSSGPPDLRRVPIGPVFTALDNPLTERMGQN